MSEIAPNSNNPFIDNPFIDRPLASAIIKYTQLTEKTNKPHVIAKVRNADEFLVFKKYSLDWFKSFFSSNYDTMDRSTLSKYITNLNLTEILPKIHPENKPLFERGVQILKDKTTDKTTKATEATELNQDLSIIDAIMKCHQLNNSGNRKHKIIKNDNGRFSVVKMGLLAQHMWKPYSKSEKAMLQEHISQLSRNITASVKAEIKNGMISLLADLKVLNEPFQKHEALAKNVKKSPAQRLERDPLYEKYSYEINHYSDSAGHTLINYGKIDNNKQYAILSGGTDAKFCIKTSSKTPFYHNLLSSLGIVAKRPNQSALPALINQIKEELGSEVPIAKYNSEDLFYMSRGLNDLLDNNKAYFSKNPEDTTYISHVIDTVINILESKRKFERPPFFNHFLTTFGVAAEQIDQSAIPGLINQIKDELGSDQMRAQYSNENLEHMAIGLQSFLDHNEAYFSKNPANARYITLIIDSIYDSINA